MKRLSDAFELKQAAVTESIEYLSKAGTTVMSSCPEDLNSLRDIVKKQNELLRNLHLRMIDLEKSARL